MLPESGLIMIQEKIYVVLVLPGKAAVFRRDGTAWVTEPIHKEDWVVLQSATSVDALLDELNLRINDRDLSRSEVRVLYHESAVDHLHGLSAQLLRLRCRRWQVLPLRDACRFAGIPAGGAAGDPELGEETVRRRLLPVLQTLFHDAGSALLQARERAESEHEEALQALAAEKAALALQVAGLQQQVDALRLPDVERLLTLLPAIYRNVWGSISPHDLALLAGGLRVPDIPSPFPDPSGDTLVALQRRLRRLPLADQQQLQAFCRNLPHRLQVRTDMLDWLEGELT